MKRSACKTCRAPIVWCETETGRRMPLDAEPAADGNTIVLGESNGTPRVRVLSPIELIVDDRPRFKSHFATCPDADDHRKPRVAEAGKCRVCGCTDQRACVGGCAWLDESHTLCSECGVWCDACPEVVLVGDSDGRLGERHVVIVARIGDVESVLHERCALQWLEDARLERERAAAAEGQ